LSSGNWPGQLPYSWYPGRTPNPPGNETIVHEEAAIIRLLPSTSFQTFDAEKYRHLRPELHNNNNSRNKSDKDKTLVGLRIDDKGGIYLQPLIDTNTAYFK
jgi:hypothetical protein